MKFRLFILSIAFLCFSCKNEQKPEGYDAVSNTGTEVSPSESGVLNEDGAEIKMDPDNTSEGAQTQKTSGSTKTIAAGRYIKTGEESDNDCSCYCLEVNFNEAKELCLAKGEMYINARFKQAGDKTVEVFFDSPVSSNKQGKDIPWKEFDTNEPIARITPTANGELELDWLGFTVNNDLAVDYAIYGKKTLEGTYKKK